MLSFPLVGPVARLAHLLGAVTDDGVSIKVSLVVSDQRLHSSAGDYPTVALAQGKGHLNGGFPGASRGGRSADLRKVKRAPSPAARGSPDLVTRGRNN